MRGFKEAWGIATAKRATAWISPQGLVEHKPIIEAELQRFQKLVQRST